MSYKGFFEFPTQRNCESASWKWAPGRKTMVCWVAWKYICISVTRCTRIINVSYHNQQSGKLRCLYMEKFEVPLYKLWCGSAGIFLQAVTLGSSIPLSCDAAISTWGFQGHCGRGRERTWPAFNCLSPDVTHKLIVHWFQLTSGDFGKCRGAHRILASSEALFHILELSLCARYTAKNFTYSVLLCPIFTHVETEA